MVVSQSQSDESPSERPSPVALYSTTDDYIDRYRHAQRTVPISSTNRGMKRLEPSAIVYLRVGDDITIVVSPINRREPNTTKVARVAMLNLFKRIITADFLKTPEMDKEEFWMHELNKHVVVREGKLYHEFHVVISRYAERSRLCLPNLPQSYIDNWMTTGGAGLRVNLHGYSTSLNTLLKFNMIPFLEVHQGRSMDSTNKSFLDDSIDFATMRKDGELTTYLMEKLDATRGDPVAYIEVLMKYYHRALDMAKFEMKKKCPQTKNKNNSFLPSSSDDSDAMFKFNQAGG